MTLLQPGLHRGRVVSALGDGDLPELAHLVDRDPLVNAVVAARVEATGTLRPAALGGTMLGVRSGTALRGAVFSGGALIPVGGDEPTWQALAERVVRRPQIASSVAGPDVAVRTMWDVLAPVWGPARAVRSAQHLLVTDRLPDAPQDPTVRRARGSDLARYLAASAAMSTDELGISPFVSPGPDAFARRIGELVRCGRAFASFDFRGQVVFKADLGVVTAHTCQVQAVWVRPDLRGRGIATASLATVIGHALRLAPTVSLYVNDFNGPARRVYAKLGMRHHATLATVLL